MDFSYQALFAVLGLSVALAAQAGPFDARDVSQVTALPDGVLFAAASGASFRSADKGANWTRMPVLVMKDGSGTFTTGPQGKLFYMEAGVVLLSTDKGLSFKETGRMWRKDQNLPPSSLSYADGALYLEHRGLFKSVDDGKSWTQVDKKYDGGAVKRAPDGALYYAASGEGLIGSTDGGRRWKSLPLNKEVRVVEAAMDGTLFASVQADPEPGVSLVHVYKSQDKGRTWEAASRGLPDQWGSTAVDLRAGQDGSMYAAVQGKVYRLAKQGRTWASISRGLPGTPECAIKGKLLSGVNHLAEGPDGELYAATRHGVFVSRNGGELWAPSLVLNTGF